MASKMLPMRPGTSAIRSLSKRRPSCSQPFSSTAPTAALPKRSQKTTSEPTKRPATTAAAPAPQSRPIPSPAFNQDFRNAPSPLVNQQMPELDDSFVGLSGGEIFHEMMLRQGVKHICKREQSRNRHMMLTLISRLPWRCHSTRIRRDIQLKTFRVHSSET